MFSEMGQVINHLEQGMHWAEVEEIKEVAWF